MVAVQDGQCGLCAHFGEHEAVPGQIIELREIRRKHEAPEDIVEACGHPAHAPLHLMVTAISGCAGFVPAKDGAEA